ncbi:MAG TPA: NDP-sugar synthase [Trebonia sp.]|jgi:mannose-1-phosphate guanylyltransferase|nr:NDP-sugar synthase [Trebonia sp.]
MPREPLEAIMLVGGKGTRLRPLTLSAPKPLLPTAGVPFLAHQLARAAGYGITHVVLATSYRAEMFTEAFGDGAGFGLSIDYVHEPEPLGTGGGIRNAAGLLRGGPDDPVVVLNGDILSGHDLTAQVDLHRKREAAVTLHLVEVDDPGRYGCVPTDPDGRVTAFLEKTPNPVTNRINAGCYVFRRSVIDRIPAGRVVSVERETFPGLIEDGAVVLGYTESAYWLDVGTPEAFVRGSCDLVLGRMPSPAVPGACGESLLLADTTVAGDARLSGGTVAGVGSAVETGAVVHGSVVFDEATIGAGAVVRDSIVGRGATIAEGAVLDGVVIGDGAFVGPGNELARGIRVWPGVRLEPTSVRFSSDA